MAIPCLLVVNSLYALRTSGFLHVNGFIVINAISVHVAENMQRRALVSHFIMDNRIQCAKILSVIVASMSQKRLGTADLEDYTSVT